ncbi:NAD(P)-dependent alcohol dehydrogenase [Pseudomonas sp. 10B1]|uniref:zinc-dependent alcohol dehydrogenase family protein n=1 Tax=unclassified Pseudomonas TaxID=196821 RepID=UPI002AB405E3|nr:MULTISPECIES: NAD(P)-dependent alcohol dehydrogenase [unclassified Pseudomonas]MDY7559852.1 NAD(P)-dependent alcohol dehydrogenase [Pseudomonas sp. AB6]MEA9977860.1 NAD(P)-dependent alcohol dehydrogenase [Pseudomonas sp. RTS4]MEA9992905.1 NAD(P)-dependent alcohol dehydrogenase [Pseudomonas sp. AA4]MEB0089080.1 NAD(P)-dependent alcohol dehydrogenase [Pseudomonas sp. RTI1]MEB0125717.1 NAD(P)-dependent alcohol dehydrogenase [Pseudomonas sp. CCC1.2]
MIDSMKRWEISSFGLDNLAQVSVPQPEPKAGEIVVKIEAVSLNYRDTEVIENGMTAELVFPFTPASDMSGTVVAVGDGVTRFRVGERVISTYITQWIDGPPQTWDKMPTQGGPIQGMLAHYVATPAEWCVRAPNSLTSTEASTMPIAALTAWMALIELGHLRAGQTVLVQGTGGVSLFAIQLAAASGATVIVTSSSDEKISRAIKLGASHGINRMARPDWQNAVLELTAGRGADHILEMAGGDNLGRSLQAVVPGGRVSIIGLLESAELRTSVMAFLSRRACIVAVAVGPRRALEDLVRMVDSHGLKPVIDGTYSFDQLPQALAHLKRGAFGKVVIDFSIDAQIAK